MTSIAALINKTQLRIQTHISGVNRTVLSTAPSAAPDLSLSSAGTQQSVPAAAGPRVDPGAECWLSSEDAKGRSSEMVKVHNFSVPSNNPKNTHTFETFCRTTIHTVVSGRLATWAEVNLSLPPLFTTFPHRCATVLT